MYNSWSQRCCIALFVLMVSMAPAWADEAGDDAIAAMMQMLENETEVATKTKMNADFVPGMVTVLRGDDLQALGMVDVWQSLSLVPGMFSVTNNIGPRDVQVRGVGPAFGSTKVLFLVNGRPDVNSVFGWGISIFTPVEQVERIEVIRGPGSAVYGGMAYSGVVNLVLREGNAMAVQGSATGTQTGALRLSNGDDHALALRLNAGGKLVHGPNLYVNQDIMGVLGQTAASQAPGYADNREKRTNVYLSADWKDYTLAVRSTHSISHAPFGFVNALAPANDPNKIVLQDTDVALSKTWQWNDSQSLDVKLGYRNSRNQLLLTTYPAGFTLNTAVTPFPFPVVYPQGLKNRSQYEENMQDATVEWQGAFASHQVLLGVHSERVRSRNTWLQTNYDVATGMPFNVTTLLGTGVYVPIATHINTGANNWLPDRISRNATAAYIQDEWQINPEITLTTGLRFDQFSDVGSSVSPRIAAVYQHSSHHIFKAQLATAFRPPTFLELYVNGQTSINAGNAALRPERSRNAELSYIYKQFDRTLKLTLYQNDMTDMIISDAANRYGNLGRVRSRGGEFEFKQQIDEQWLLDGNVSYSAAVDQLNHRNIIDSARWLGNAHLSYHLGDHSIHMLGQYVGARARAPLDTRPAFPANQVWSAAWQQKNLGPDGLTMTINVQNLFDKQQRQPSTVGQVPSYGTQLGYVNDLAQPGRSIWFKLAYTLE